jgi:hypothetical protein
MAHFLDDLDLSAKQISSMPRTTLAQRTSKTQLKRLHVKLPFYAEVHGQQPAVVPPRREEQVLIGSAILRPAIVLYVAA